MKTTEEGMTIKEASAEMKEDAKRETIITSQENDRKSYSLPWFQILRFLIISRDRGKVQRIPEEDLEEVPNHSEAGIGHVVALENLLEEAPRAAKNGEERFNK